jgi:phosphatidylglycerol:prolipoprotein diacylglycerol transferase
MDYMAISFPAIDPVAIALGPVQIRWYGLAYLAGLTLGWLYMRRLLSTPALWSGGQPPMKPSQADDFLLWATFGTVVGGRLGYVLFYEPGTFFADPARIFAVWEGGMSFHGGFLGVALAIILFARYNRIVLLSLGDIAAASVPFGLFFGRIANFINGELYGKITNVPWAMVFPEHLLNAGDAVASRHPSQFYQAFLEGIVLFLVIRFFTHRRGALKQPGLCVGIFMCGYALARITGEVFREWDYTRFFTTPYFSTGQVYSIPMLIAGIVLISYVTRKREPKPA